MNHLNTLIEQIPVKLLQQAAQEISTRYRLQEKPYLNRTEHYLAYLVTRFPATLAAITQVLKQVKDFEIDSLLDLGAGPGTGFFAANQYFPQLSQITLLESDPQFIALGKKIIDTPVHWQQAQLPCDLPAHDLVLMSYSLNEMPQLEKVITQAFAATQKLLVIIEPGTPKGYQRILQARALLIQQQAHIIAPCPHALDCPMQNDNWCHFPVRVQRSKLHRQLKGGELGFEDEKYSYLIASKHPHPTASARIIEKPELHKGWVQLKLCAEGKIREQKITAKDKAPYKKSRKSSWGDEY